MVSGYPIEQGRSRNSYSDGADRQGSHHATMLTSKHRMSWKHQGENLVLGVVGGWHEDFQEEMTPRMKPEGQAMGSGRSRRGRIKLKV